MIAHHYFHEVGERMAVQISSARCTGRSQRRVDQFFLVCAGQRVCARQIRRVIRIVLGLIAAALSAKRSEVACKGAHCNDVAYEQSAEDEVRAGEAGESRVRTSLR